MIHKFILERCARCNLPQGGSNAPVWGVRSLQRTLCSIVAVLFAMVLPALSGTVSANFTSASSIPVTASSYSATGNSVSIALGFAPSTGVNLTVVNNTGLGFITGQFSNLTQGQVVNLSYNGTTYKFVANYYGGTGNDLVLQWAYQDLAAWGANGSGQLGNSNTTSTSVPVSVNQSGVLAGKTVVKVSAGDSHSLTLCSDGTVAAWGSNSYGQLGNGSTNDSNVPVLVNQSGVLAGKTVISVSAGYSHSLALCSDGTVAAWGYNGNRQLGNGTTNWSSVPVMVTQSGVLAGKTVVAVSAGYSSTGSGHSLALCSDGTVAAWGSNSYGQLGNNSNTSSSVPVLVTQSGVLSGKTVVTVSAGADHSIALCSDGTLATWGWNTNGQLGNGSIMTYTSVPVLVNQSGVLASKTVVAVSMGYSHSLALCSDGTVAAWGYNCYGKLGNGSANSSNVPVSVYQSGVLKGKKMTAVSAGQFHSLALCSDGTVVAWGHNSSGQLGNNSALDSNMPVLVTQSDVLVGKTVLSVAGGGYQSLALAAVSNSCDLASITLSSGTLSPGFNTATTSYSTSVPYATSSVTVTPTSSVNIATISVNGIAITSGGSSQTIPLVVGANTITVLVTAPDGATTKTYTVTVTRLPGSSVATLSGLTLSSGTLSPAFTTARSAYTASVSNTTSSLTVTPTVTDTTATVKVNGTPVTSGTASGAIPLVVGPNTITVEVTAQDGIATTTYTITVTRAPSTISTLSGLILSSGTLNPVLYFATTAYSASVANTTSSLTVKPTVTDPTATVSVNGMPVTSGTNSQDILLVFGNNTINIEVTAQDGESKKIYTVTVLRPDTIVNVYTSPTDCPVNFTSYDATGIIANLSLGFTPSVGTNLTVVKNTGLGFITGKFSNLSQGQVVNLSYNGTTYKFVANYYGGTGNDLVLQWAYQNISAWGMNVQYGQLGNGTTTNSSVPVLVKQSGVLSGKTAITVSAGDLHSIALCSDGTVAAWGSNSYGQLGNNSTTSSSVPVLVNQSGVLAGKTVIAVSARSGYSLALCSDGTIAAWGYNYYGQLGNGTTTDSSVPVLVSQSGVLAGKTVVAVSAGYYHSLALCSDGTIAAWGYNSQGGLGNNSTADSSVPVSVYQSGVLAGKTVTAVTAGASYSLSLCSDGTVAAWGRNYSGELGNGTTTDSSVPVLVTRIGVLAGKTVTAITAGADHSLALCSDGTIAAWGYNSQGGLGNNSTADSSVPVSVYQSGVLAGKTVTAVTAGEFHSLALCQDGTVSAWGYNNYGKLGNGSSTDSRVPILVRQNGILAGKTVVAVSAGMSHNLALASVQNSNDLVSVTLSAGTLSPGFNTATTSYSASVPYATSSVTVTPTSSVNIATISVNGIANTSGGSSQTIPLAVGANTITVLVTAPDGVTTKTYTVTVTRLQSSSVATLSGLTLSSGTLSPAFTTARSAYTASVSNTTPSVMIVPTVTDTTATVKVNGTPVTSGTNSQVIPLVVGANTITVTVTAQDGVTILTYTVTVNRISTVSTLSELALNTGTISPTFSSSTTAYTASVSNTTPSVMIVPTVKDPAATVNVNGTPVTSGTNSQVIPLVVGANTITVTVTAQDGVTKTTYTVTVNRLSTISTLSGLVLNPGMFSPTFSSSTTAYTASVSNTTSSLTVMPTVTDPTSTVKVNGTPVTSGSNSQAITLLVGTNIITTVVTAQDGIATTTYTITVTRAPSTISTLSGLILSSGTLSPAFASATTDYSASVSNTTSSVAILPTVTDPTSTVKVNGTPVTSGSNSQAITLLVGTNIITTVVTAQDGIATTTYTVTVTRAPSTISTLSGLILSSGTLNPTFAVTTTGYAITTTATSLTATPTVTDSTATIKVNGSTVSSGATSGVIPLALGTNTVNIVVTAQDGVTKATYTITANRLSTVSTLSGLVPSSGTLSPTFSPATTAYTASVSNTTPSVTILPTVTDPTATIKVNGAPVTSGTASGAIPLVVGTNIITTVVTAQDGTTSTYTVTVTRVYLDATFTSATTVPFRSSSYNATENSINLSLGFAPATGTNLTVVDNTGLNFITGRFFNLSQGQAVTLKYNNASYRFVANYYGGTGNDLVLQWAYDKAYAWGSNSRGQLGNNSATSSSLPVAVTSTGVLSGKTILSISTGSSHSLALCSDGTVAAWGYNYYGQLGNGTAIDSSVPVAVTQNGVLAGKTVISVSAGYSHSLALCSDGTVAAWGWNTYGQLGNGVMTDSNVPVEVSRGDTLAGKTVVAVRTGYYHNIALCSDGTVVSWGRNNYGQLGNNSSGTNSNVPVNITTSGTLSGRSVSTLAAGSDHSLVLCLDGSMVTWGRNNNGQLGDGSNTNSPTPVDVDSSDVLAGRIVQTISAGGFHNIAACVDGTLVAFGRNTNGQLGNNTTADANAPVAITLSPALIGKTVIALQAANAHSMAICSDGSIASWGSGSNGLLGTGDTINSNVPAAVVTSGLGSGEKFTALASGSSASHSLVLAAIPLSSGSTLATLSLSAGTLNPVFSSGVTHYTATVADGSLTVTPTVGDASSTVQVNGASATSGASSGVIPLALGDNNVSVTVTAEDGTQTAYTVTVTRTGGTYEAWKDTVFKSVEDRNNPAISGWQATPANDGITNLTKYALALDPIACGTGQLPTAMPHDGYLTLTYRKNKQASDVTFTVQASDTLAGDTWSAATTVVSQSDEGDYWVVTVRDTVTQAGHPVRFMRLKVGN